MTPQEVAIALDGNEYGKEIARDLEQRVKAAGIVVVFGGSDDLIEFRGAIHDERGGPGVVHLTKKGLLVSQCGDDDCPYFAKEKERATTITSVWCPGGTDLSWSYTTDIPHETFTIKEDGDNYCRGIVFDLADVPS